jgi:hypothetical protein
VNFRRTFTGFVLLLLTLSCFSQADTLVSRKKVSSAIKISLDGSLIYPGACLGIEFPVYSVDLIRLNRVKDTRLIIKDRFVSANAGWYHHQGFHDNLYFTSKWIMRKTSRSGIFTEFSPGLGYSRTFLGGTTYKVENNGTVDIVKSAGYNYAVVTVGVGIGFSFLELKKIPLSVFYDFNILAMFPYNSTIYFRPVMELGLIYRPDNFIPLVIKKKIVKK